MANPDISTIVNVNVVIANFLTANKFKDFDFGQDGDRLEEKLKVALSEFSYLPEKIMIDRITGPVRRKNLLQQSWAIEEVALKYIGSYPKIGDLPKDWCQASVVDTAKFVRENPDCVNQYESVRRIYQIQPHLKIISKYLLPILLPGGEIRKDSKLLTLPFDSDDGNHRLVAAALSGVETTLAYVGIPFNIP